ncbi:transglycosylase domain-containing protein [Antarcticirhabdus aurantiaca]|uniref:PBP1A family penicillin-binding protein n=1 Tax=Antarcticirhabdus aurantiaca TaxID=2606717 RepID=A0ACD4NQ29_9HYPH|nr:PBP1A family penicillin-binding protein [Antarcticirhabdus aurantiaca]WAJ28973.1 PBP1A family penicillin-binding protein [Jeongeuplla avenae]
MARRNGQERIEPTFGGAANDRDEGHFSISTDDRAVVGPARATARRASPRDPGFGGPDGAGRGRDEFFDGIDDHEDDSMARAAASRSTRAAPKAAKTRAATKSGGARRGWFGGRGGGGSSSGGGGRAPKRRRSFLGHVFRLFLFMGLWGGVAVACVVGWFAVKLPQEAWEIPARPPNVKIVSVTGDLVANRGITGGKEVALDQMSPFIPQAVMAIEDRRFYDHWGVDPIGIVRAFSQNMAAGETVQGGSTLTQQLAKNIFLNPDQTIQRKIQEAVLSLWLESRFSKDQILEMYLNRVYFGSGATGVDAAARRYFNKSPDEVDLGEAALLAGVLKAPSRLSPANDPAAAQARAEVVLQAMLEEGFITREQFDAARRREPTQAKAFWTGAENYAADLVMRDIKALVGEVKEDVVVETTLDLDLNAAAEKAIRQTVDGAKQNVSQGALVAIDGTGAIRAMVGGRDYASSQFNRAVDAKRQPGSAFKPFVYEAALEFGWRPESMMNDTPVRIGNWQPQNYDGKFRGQVTMAEAVAKSLNTVAAKITADVGPATVIQTANRLGIASPMVDNASLALGTSEVSLMELTGAYAPWANGGYLAKPHLVNRVTTENGRVLYERGAEVPPIVVPSEDVGMMNSMLMGVVTKGTGRKAQVEGWQTAGKSGTTQDFKDAWFVGYTSNLVAGVWLGNDNGALMKKVTGGSLPAEAFSRFMTAAHEGLSPMPLPGNYVIGAEHPPLTASAGQPQGIDPQGNPVGLDPAAGGQLPTSADPYASGIDPFDASGQPIQPPAGQPQPQPQQASRGEPAYTEYPMPDDPTYRGESADPELSPYGADPGLPEYGELPPDEYYYDEAGGRPMPPGDVYVEPPARIDPSQLPPDAVLEGRAGDRSLFRGLFGG